FCHVERLAHEALDLTGAGHDQFVLFGQLVHAQDRDDVLERLVLLQHFLNATGNFAVLLANNVGIENTRVGGQRVNGRVDALFRDRAVQHGHGVEVGEGRCRSRVGQVVGGHVHGLNRGDRALVRGGDAFLHLTHVGRQRRLVTHSGGDAAKQSRHFSASLGKAEDVVHEEQHVLALVTEVLCNGQTRQSNASAGTRGLVHLAEHEGALGTSGRATVFLGVLVHARFDHFVIQVVAFAGTFTHASEHRITTVRLGDVVDQFLDQNGLANAGAAHEADLAAASVRSDEVNDLDAGDQNLRLRVLLGKGRSVLVDFARGFSNDRTSFVDRLADDVHDAAEGHFTDGNGDSGAQVSHFGAANEAFRGVHGNGAHCVFTQVLRHFQHKALAVVGGLKGIENGGQVIVKHDVDDGADDLRYATGLFICHLFVLAVRLERFGARNDFDEFFGDLGLALTVVAQLQLADHFASVAGRVVHCGHLRTVERSVILEHGAEDLHGNVPRQKILDNGLFAWLVLIGHRGRCCLAFAFDSLDTSRNDLHGLRHLADHRVELGKEQGGDVEFTGGEQRLHLLGDLARLGKADILDFAI